MTNPSRGSRFLFVVAWTVALAATFLPAATAATKLIKLETPEFEVISDASAGDVRRFATGYAAYRKVFATLLLPEGRQLPRNRIVLFKRQNTFETLLTTGSKRSDNTHLATYQGEIDDHVLTATAVDGDRDRALRLIYEFDTIWGLRRSGYALPIWATQGAGEVLAGLVWKSDGITIGRPATEFTNRLHNARLLPWERFFEVNVASPEYKDRTPDRVFHAQAWLFMHYVLLGGESWQDGRRRLDRLAAAMSTTTSDLEAVEQAFDLTPDALNDTIKHYRRNYPKPVKLPFDEDALIATARIGPASEVEWLVSLSDLAAFVRKDYERYTYLEQARALDPTAIEVLEAFGRQAWRERDADTAFDYYQQAIAAGTTNAATYLRSATIRLQRAGYATRLSPGGWPAGFARPARDEVERSLELFPQNDEAWATLARILIVATDTKPAETALLDDAVRRQVRGQHIRYLRALLRERFDDITGARDDLRRVVLDGSDERLRESARDVLFRITVTDVANEVQQLAAHQNFAAARITLSAARDALKELPAVDPAGNLVRLQAWLDQSEALDRLNAHQQAGNWQSLLVGAEAFIAAFPDSSRLSRVKEMAELARRKGAATDL